MDGHGRDVAHADDAQVEGHDPRAEVRDPRVEGHDDVDHGADHGEGHDEVDHGDVDASFERPPVQLRGVSFELQLPLEFSVVLQRYGVDSLLRAPLLPSLLFLAPIAVLELLLLFSVVLVLSSILYMQEFEFVLAQLKLLAPSHVIVGTFS